VAKFAKFLAGLIFVLAVPVFLFAGNLIWVVLDVGTYERLLFSYGAAARTGLSAAELRAVATAFAAHFRDGTPFALTVLKGGARVPLFTERELVHLHDIYNLVQFGLRSLALMGAYFLLFAALGLRWWQGRYWRSLAGYVLRGGLLTLGLLAVVGGLMLVDFEQLFWVFHVVSFPNDYWLLDPSQSYLINLFSQEFAQDTALLVAGVTAGEALLLSLVAGGVIWWGGRYGPANRAGRAGIGR